MDLASALFLLGAFGILVAGSIVWLASDPGRDSRAITRRRQKEEIEEYKRDVYFISPRAPAPPQYNYTENNYYVTNNYYNVDSRQVTLVEGGDPYGWDDEEETSGSYRELPPRRQLSSNMGNPEARRVRPRAYLQ